ncbi:hypothetical protein [Inquilinus limosus]|uniref:Uncharacterized protein n=1 Tax=Inquilinus limosus TaxID=171674 RepID=A0A211ZJX5_9PROT|nr:hypothetical protein [Inquilinus limosus]OWJ65560.1 hypothetical protein BWR60_18765 [Inquilinus limosus]
MAGGQPRAPRSEIAEWAARYLERLDQPFDDWEADFFRRGCSFLSRRLATGAASSWRSMTLPPERRDEVYSGPLAARPLTVEETARLRGMLQRIVREG